MVRIVRIYVNEELRTTNRALRHLIHYLRRHGEGKVRLSRLHPWSRQPVLEPVLYARGAALDGRCTRDVRYEVDHSVLDLLVRELFDLLVADAAFCPAERTVANVSQSFNMYEGCPAYLDLISSPSTVLDGLITLMILPCLGGLNTKYTGLLLVKPGGWKEIVNVRLS